jgi:nucleoside-diphosphate-sugar epimerase
MRIAVTGGAGKAGRWVVRDLRERGHDVLSVDIVPAPHEDGPSLLVDLADLGQCHEILVGTDAVVHLAAIPAWGIRTEGETFRNNMLSTWNVFAAATAERLSRVVYASSETVLGIPFAEPPPYGPLDEDADPRPESSYALSKLLGEVAAAQFSRRTATTFVGLRFSNIMEPADYADFPRFQGDATERRWNLWGYIDVRDVAGSVAAALDARIDGSVVCMIAAADTVMARSSADLMAEAYPAVPLRRAVEGRETLLSIERARSVLGFEPAHSWTDHTDARP